MIRLIVVKRIPVDADFDYAATKLEHDDAKRRGDYVTAEHGAIVIRTKVYIRTRAA